MKDIIQQYITESHRKAIQEQKEYSLFNKIYVFLLSQVNSAVDVIKLIAKLEKEIPEGLFAGVDAIYIGNFKEFSEREVVSVFKDGAIYVSAECKNLEKLFSAIVHELGHAVEEQSIDDIYSDGSVEKEFLGKRRKLQALLKQDMSLAGLDFENPEYSEEFDEFLYKKIGYSKLAGIAEGLFNSPYAITSLREYFANGFEEVFTGDSKYVKLISPRLFEKIQTELEKEGSYI